MSRTKLVQVFHPKSDGVEAEEPFSRLLMDCYRVAAHGMKWVDLCEIQAELLRRGWHPWK